METLERRASLMNTQMDAGIGKVWITSPVMGRSASRRNTTNRGKTLRATLSRRSTVATRRMIHRTNGNLPSTTSTRVETLYAIS